MKGKHRNFFGASFGKKGIAMKENFKEINITNRQIYNKIEEKERKLKEELKDLLSGKWPRRANDLRSKSNE